MRKIYTLFLLAALVLTLPAVHAIAAPQKAMDDIQVAIEVRSGTLYDYILIGMNANATDGRDGLYDTVTPGMAMNDQYITMVVPHPEWPDVRTNYRTDFRSVKKSDIWDVQVTTNKPDGTLLSMSIDWTQTKLPASYAVVVEDMATGAVQAIDQAGPYDFPVKASGIAQQFRITIEKERGKEHR